MTGFRVKMPNPNICPHCDLGKHAPICPVVSPHPSPVLPRIALGQRNPFCSTVDVLPDTFGTNSPAHCRSNTGKQGMIAYPDMLSLPQRDTVSSMAAPMLCAAICKECVDGQDCQLLMLVVMQRPHRPRLKCYGDIKCLAQYARRCL